MMTITPRVRIAWTNTCEFSGVYDDVTADVIDARWDCGFEKPYISRIAKGGLFDVTLDNSANNQWRLEGLYSPTNTASPLYGYSIPRRPITLDLYKNGTWYQKFTGWIDSIDDGGDPCAATVRVRAIDSMASVMTSVIQMPMLTDIRSDELIYQILVRSNVPRALCGRWLLGIPSASELGITTILGPAGGGYVLDVGRAVYDYAGDWPAEGVKPWDALRDAVLPEWGRFYADPTTGGFTFHNQLWEIVDNTPAAYMTADHITDVQIDTSVNRVKNHVVVTINPRDVGSPGTILASLQNRPRVRRGERQEYNLGFRDPVGGQFVGALSIDGHTLTANQFEDGSGADRSTWFSATYDDNASGTLAHVQNGGSKQAYITALRSTGTPLYRYDPVQYTAQDGISQGNYGKRTLAIDLYLGDDARFAQALADYLLDLFRDPMLHLDAVSTANLDGECEDLILNLSLLSLLNITLPKYDIASNHRIIGEQGMITDSGNRIEVTWNVERHNWQQYWVLGDATFGLLGMTTILGPF